MRNNNFHIFNDKNDILLIETNANSILLRFIYLFDKPGIFNQKLAFKMCRLCIIFYKCLGATYFFTFCKYWLMCAFFSEATIRSASFITLYHSLTSITKQKQNTIDDRVN